MMSDRPRFELNTVQLAASVLAAVTGAVLTSYLGVGGTIIGTAVGSLVSTSGFAIYKHYLGRTKERINHVAPVIVEHARVWTPTSGYLPVGHTGHTGHTGQAGRAARATQAGHPGNGAGRPSANGSTAGYGRPEDQQTEPLRVWDFAHPAAERPGGEPAPPTQPAGRPALNGAGGKPPAGRLLRGRPRWLQVAVTSAAVFVLVIAVITVFELATGKPLAATVQGQKGSGLSLGGGVTGTSGSSTGNGSGHGTPQPTQSPAPSQSATTPGSGQTTPPPSSGASTSPTPSTVPSPSTAPSVKVTAPASAAPVGSGPPTG
jgi:hypothetical protein